MSKFPLWNANSQYTESVSAKIEASCAFQDDKAKLYPVFFRNILRGPETQLRVRLVDNHGSGPLP